MKNNNQIKKINETINMGKEVIYSIDKAIGSLNSAKNWSTYDIFSKGGLLSHMFKYNNINKANEIMSELKYKLERFKKEIENTNSYLNYSLNTYSAGLKTMDYFFDNIFTDFHVRNKISSDKESLIRLKENINNILFDLKNKKINLERDNHI